MNTILYAFHTESNSVSVTRMQRKLIRGVIALLLFMTTAEAKPYGSWKSPITTDMIIESAIRLGEIRIDGDTLYWSEIRPSEKGRSVIVTLKDGKRMDVTPSTHNVRTAVHEYGGGAFSVCEETIYLSNFNDQHLYSLKIGEAPKELTSSDNKRYAEPLYSKYLQTLIAVEEIHHSEREVENRLVTIDPNGKDDIVVLHTGHDFYASATLSTDGEKVAFLTWDHPQMPWDGTELWTASLLPDRTLSNLQKVAGGLSESIFQPLFAPDGTLYFISDESGFWNLYRLEEETIYPCYPMEAEFGTPQWIFGFSRYAFISRPNGYQIACIYTVKGIDHLAIFDPKTEKLEPISLPYTTYSDLHATSSHLYFHAASPTEVRTLFSYELSTQILQPQRTTKKIALDSGYFSIPETLEFPSHGDQTAYAFYYPPTNKDITPPSNEKPPLIVKSHGGPSSHVTAILNLEVQFWTSRGFAFLDVNYGGSTGYGREYRERLKGNWGVVDVNDCINGSQYLAKKGLVDPNRMAIRGGSAGGFTTLAALTFHDVFRAGATYYGVSDLIALAEDTHKFESHYLEGLVGVYPEQKERYLALSPINHIDRLSCPVIVFQGNEDKVVPPNQSEMVFNALKGKSIPVAYVLFKGEQHGFRKAENIKAALENELYFYSKVFQFTPADALPPLQIENLEP